ncbi:sigma-54-dependent transcriptional regulator [Undibacterium sp. JH2W]|uniref:sigma-54-dependent transcriptional regulator n=1 Tax=Undibacterium sp. JH2W TaxID=3413037 RepID=UPI003BF27690
MPAIVDLSSFFFMPASTTVQTPALNISILIIDDDPDVACAAQLLLRRHCRHVSALTDTAQLRASLQAAMPEVVLLDMNFTPGRTDGAEGLSLLSQLRALNPAPAIIMMTAYADVPLAVEALKRGACDFITKPWNNERLVATVQSAASRYDKQGLSLQDEDFPELMGHAASMRELKSIIRSVAPTEANVLILGENGTGKELVARAIHQHSARREATFLPVDMGSIPESTFESEMYGHKKGAFTDARQDRAGRFQTAAGGVLFLDEIGNLPLGAQAKLLHALERREVTPIGADRAEKVDVRIISATNLNEASLFDATVFRPDLLFRLNTIVLRIPALRERVADIPMLLAHYLQSYQQQYQRPARNIDSNAVAALSVYAWPGNVRELRHACERAVILATQENYVLADFGLPLAAIDEIKPPAIPVGVTETIITSSEYTLAALERQTIANAMSKAEGNISQAAKLLGLSRAALYRKLEKHDI